MKGAIEPDFWAGKNVLLTGHTGFKGSWLCEVLLHLGAKVHGVALAPDTRPSLFEALDLKNRITQHEIGDIRTPEVLQTAFARAQPDVAIHMAAQPIVSVGYEDPVGTFSTNVMGTAHFLEAAREQAADIPLLVVSSDKCYRNPETGAAFTEDSPLGGKDPYSASKAGTELVCEAYRASFFGDEGTPRMASARAGNVIGGGDWCVNRLVPDMARAFAAGETVVIRSPSSTRPWQHVLEPVVGYLLCVQALAEDRGFARAWNFGPRPEEIQPVSEVVRAMAAAWGPDARVRIDETRKNFAEAQTLVLDGTAIQGALNWRTRLTFEEAVAWTAAWYKSFYTAPDSAGDMTREQIRHYLTLAGSQNG